MNISEGRDQGFLEKISGMIKTCPDVCLLSCSSDIDHNRSVFTFAGSPGGILEASWIVCKETYSSLDIRLHSGVHPRIGVVDVVPFIPLKNSTLEECSESAHMLGKRIGSELLIPVYMYGKAASNPERSDLAYLRKGELPGLEKKIRSEPPDYGPSRIHPTAGATAVGARDILIAYNIDLDSRDISVARRIARAIREKDGGMPCVKALGLYLKSRDCVQVSMNLTDYRVTSVSQVFSRVLQLSAQEGIEVIESEIIGHLPRAALDENSSDSLRIKSFKPEKVYIEDNLERQTDEGPARK